MSEPQIVRTLREKRNHIEQSPKSYEMEAEQCRRDQPFGLTTSVPKPFMP